MKNRFLIVSIFICLFLSACSQTNYIKSGRDSSDFSIISNGRFDVSVVNVDFITDGYVCSDAFYKSGEFCYLLKSDIAHDIKVISFDSNGTGYNDLSLELPIALNNQKFSSGQPDLIDDFKDCESPYLYYFEPFFNDDGFVEGYCELNGVKYSETAPTAFLLYDYKITWNLDGSINSVDRIELDDEARGNLIMHDYRAVDNNGNIFAVTDSGVVRCSDGKYVDTYFDYINSSYNGTIGKIVYADEDKFSAVTYFNSDYISFSIFNRAVVDDKKISPISLYCSVLSNDLKKQIIAFNENSSKYLIGVRNYSDIYRNYNEEFFDDPKLNNVALSGLEESVLSGDIPDIIYEHNGYDQVLINKLSDKNIILDLKNGFLKDEKLSGNTYLSNLINFSGDKPVYGIIPSFNYDTYVAAASNNAISTGFKLDDYVDYKSQNQPGLILMNSYSCDDYLCKALAFNGYNWIDIDSGTVSLGNDYKTYLELSSELPDSKEEFFELSTSGQIPVNIQLFYTSFSTLPGYYVDSWNMVCDEPVNVGFPSESGSSKVIHPSGTLMICSGRKAADGCWEFARTFLLPDYQNSIENGIPVLQSSFDIWRYNLYYFAYFSNQLKVYKDGMEVSIPPLDQEKADSMSNEIISCNKLYFTDPTIEEIVLKRAHDYYNGDITVDEAVEKTEKEINEYLNSSN